MNGRTRVSTKPIHKAVFFIAGLQRSPGSAPAGVQVNRSSVGARLLRLLRGWRCERACLVVVLVIACAAPHAAAQPALRGPWLDAAQQRIEALRKTDVRVIVLNAAGEPVQNARVHIDQQRHDFPIGFTLADANWPTSAGSDAPLWRCFNAVSLDELTDWPTMSPLQDAPPELEPIEDAVRAARRAGFVLRFGGLISADFGRNPGWLAGLSAHDQQAALAQRLAEAFRATPGGMMQYDLYSHTLDHDGIEETFGLSALRALYEQARVLAPRASIGLHVRDALLGRRMNEMARRVTAMRHAFIPLDHVAIEQRMSRQLVQAPLQRSFEQLEGLDMDVVLVGLEIGGSSEAAAAYNLEVLLRTAFASKAVRGIWFGPLTEAVTTAEHGALLNEEGGLTPAGEVVDRLFHEMWRTEERATTDALGNVRASVFTGVHRVTATLPNGEKLDMTVRVAPGDDERIVLLAPGERSVDG